MVNEIKASDSHGLNEGRSSKFCVGSRIRQETPEEGRRTHRLKHCEYINNINKDEDDSPKTLNRSSINKDLELINKKRIHQLVDFAVLVDH